MYSSTREPGSQTRLSMASLQIVTSRPYDSTTTAAKILVFGTVHLDGKESNFFSAGQMVRASYSLGYSRSTWVSRRNSEFPAQYQRDGLSWPQRTWTVSTEIGLDPNNIVWSVYERMNLLLAASASAIRLVTPYLRVVRFFFLVA